jgi:hypothetical protein
MKKVIFAVCIAVLLFTIVFSGCFEEYGKEFEIHEWGVFVKGYDCDDVSLLVESPELMFVRKPVIYFHFLENATNVKVDVRSINNATVIPDATKDGTGISWDVTVKNNQIVMPNGTEYPNLFYEGEIICPTSVIANITNNVENVTYYVKNMENYTISNVFVIYGELGHFVPINSSRFDCVYFGDLIPGEEKTIVNTSSEQLFNTTKAKNTIRDKLMLDGLTLDEADELIDYWEAWWFYPTNYGAFTRVIYSIPQSVYDRLLPLSITPQPEIIKRVGIFTITDIPVNFTIPHIY